MDDVTVDVLRDDHAAQLVERSLAGDAYADLDLVFAHGLGAFVNPQRLTDRFRGHREAAGIRTRARCTR